MRKKSAHIWTLFKGRGVDLNPKTSKALFCLNLEIMKKTNNCTFFCKKKMCLVGEQETRGGGSR